jgi:hypothetical protein
MKSRYEKLIVVQEFLNVLVDDLRLNWNHSVESTYQMLYNNSIDGHAVIDRDMTKDRVYHFIKL